MNDERPPVTWTRKQTNPGTEYRARDGRVVVLAIEWAKPGFRGITSRGWVIEIDGQQLGPAHRTAKAAMAWAELPGIYNTIAGTIERHDRERKLLRCDTRQAN